MRQQRTPPRTASIPLCNQNAFPFGEGALPLELRAPSPPRSPPRLNLVDFFDKCYFEFGLSIWMFYVFLATGTLVLGFMTSLYFNLFVRPRRLFCLLSRIAVDYGSWFFILFCFDL